MAAPAWAQDEAPLPSATPATTTGQVPQLEVVAPGDLRKLLERHLDLARAIADQLATQQASRPSAAAPAASAASAPDSAIEINDAEWSRLIAAAPGQARQLVQTEGYFAAQAKVERQGRRVVLTLEPGPVARVDKLVIDIQGELGDALERRDRSARQLHDSLLQDWGLPVGAAFRQSDWASAKNAVVARLHAEGYAAATWSCLLYTSPSPRDS